jgi:hypothetical protein
MWPLAVVVPADGGLFGVGLDMILSRLCLMGFGGV